MRKMYSFREIFKKTNRLVRKYDIYIKSITRNKKVLQWKTHVIIKLL